MQQQQQQRQREERVVVYYVVIRVVASCWHGPTIRRLVEQCCGAIYGDWRERASGEVSGEGLLVRVRAVDRARAVSGQRAGGGQGSGESSQGNQHVPVPVPGPVRAARSGTVPYLSQICLMAAGIGNRTGGKNGRAEAGHGGVGRL